MKALFLLFVAGLTTQAMGMPPQADSTGLAGDGFSLRGALELFKQSKDLSAFEEALNTEGNGVSNLDLDANGEVDFIHVRAQADGEARVVVLQAAYGKDDRQDIAAIQMERTAEGTVALQIRGDDTLYPEGTIVEPSETLKEDGGKRGGPWMPAAQITVWVNVWGWPCVQWCYGPFWWEWSSPWYWGYYPTWWRPWRPWGWHAWWGYPRPYWSWYHPVNVCRVEHAHNVYMHRRSMSSTVRNRPDVNRDGRLAPERRLDRKGGEPPKRPTVAPKPQRERMPVTKPQRQPERKPVSPAPRNPAPRRNPAPAPRTPQKAPGGGGKR